MANTLTGLTVTIYNALDVVSRELTGFIPAVSSDMTYNRAAKGQTVTSPVAPAATATDINPGVTPPNDGDQNIGKVDMTITKARRVPVRWNGEEKLALDNNGASYNTILRDQFAQAMRTLANEVEADVAGLAIGASRAVGTAGTTPFATNLKDSALALKALQDNGAPKGDLQLVIDTTAGANMRTLGQLTKANEANDDSLLRRGVLLDVHGFAIRESAQVVTPASGTGASATTNAAGYAIGATSITLASAGTGTIVAGDVITFAGDTNQYVVVGGDTDVSNGGTITLAKPGLRKAIPAAATAITVAPTSTRNLAFARSAIALATRIPALPKGGDSADDRMIVTDPVSGLSFEIAIYRQYRQVQYEVSLAWGCAMVKPEHSIILLG
ncbi:P22 coat - protein 5 family protein [Acinetobacter baumannii]|uniref:P22 coat - protein 5 family protein n=1 Tax=Acinetobacter baumannii TaxID=470 RepID=UPI0007435494|nr:P22 coat - protein 5 family protein [Acinetobacter baumannii]ATP86050.1 P22 coat protein - gene protein 5 [Acinetobacter baumannii]MCF4280295.1 P22 coat - protein 5 family protein [Acinetobacter baumannii]MCF4287950.1 P22 coat - protein 5 family protein [Acinetobacter baumannii]MCF4299068.1 P22 coat - protein 5 family protein [Acinetobacter baumannii]MCF4388476.1 P22 coat - protein 5 family protein [Acinetobacter baumannii]